MRYFDGWKNIHQCHRCRRLWKRDHGFVKFYGILFIIVLCMRGTVVANYIDYLDLSHDNDGNSKGEEDDIVEKKHIYEVKNDSNFASLSRLSVAAKQGNGGNSGDNSNNSKRVPNKKGNDKTLHLPSCIAQPRGGGRKKAGEANKSSINLATTASSREESSVPVPSDSTSSTQSSSPKPDLSRPVTVNISGYGKAVGRREGGVDVWRGIPYAAPPVGILRFAPPEPPQPWSPTRLDASRYSPDCWQAEDPVTNPEADVESMSEDCLYLNVWTPAGHAARSRQSRFLSGTKLPVMVWLHGGAFQQGGACRQEYDGRRLAERDNVVVTLNYRLGALGFLVSSHDGLYGNYGLMDQRAAIYWVHENIAAFGGDSNKVTLFGESAGAVMTGLHLMMEGAGDLFHKAIMQSNPLGYTFRSVIVADFIGEALKVKVDCRDLACLRSERVEEIIAAQCSLMGVPRSVGDFFTWGPVLTKEVKLEFSLHTNGGLIARSEEHRLPRFDSEASQRFVSEWRRMDKLKSSSVKWSAVNVSQPLKSLDLIPPDVPIIVGSNKHEGEIFIHSAFPTPMPKAVYWMFVGALFRDSAARILKHYRGLVEEVERIAEAAAKKQIEEEEAKHFFLENREHLEREYQMLLALNCTQGKESVYMKHAEVEGLQALINTWATGGHINGDTSSSTDQIERSKQKSQFCNRLFKRHKSGFLSKANFLTKSMSTTERVDGFFEQKGARRKARQKARALKEAAKVIVDYRPVMSRIMGDYLFRCPSWHMAQVISERREGIGVTNNVYVYRFSQPTHIPGYRECWGKSCHTAELPFMFEAMDVLRSNYSTVGPFAQMEAPSAPIFPYTEMLTAYHEAVEAAQAEDTWMEAPVQQQIDHENFNTTHHSKAFQKILRHFFGEYFTVDADEELASDMAERWSSFAQTGDPNYDGSKEHWMAWWNREGNTPFTSGNTENNGSRAPWKVHDEWQTLEDEWTESHLSDNERDFYGKNHIASVVAEEERAEKHHALYRRNVLDTLGLQVAEEGIFRTELKRMKFKEGAKDGDRPFFSGLDSRRRKKQTDRDEKGLLPQYKLDAILEVAQHMGVIGEGLLGESKRPEYLPEILDLSWPPEGRLIERDCTCDMWDRIRYRY